MKKSNLEAGMVQYEERMVPVRGGKFNIRVSEGGAGDALLYLHGEDGFTGWAPFLDTLAQSYHVYSPAHPGLNSSTGLDHLDDMWDLVLFYEELMQELGLERTHVVGHSYGGMLAAELAAHRPEKVARLVLVSSLGLWLEEAPILDFFILTPEERAEVLWHDPNSDAAKSALSLPQDPAVQREKELEQVQTLATVGKFVWPIPDRGLSKRIHRLTMPTLLVWGDSDSMVPPEYGRAFQRLLADPTLKVIEKCGHFPQQEQPSEFLEATLGFLGS